MSIAVEVDYERCQGHGKCMLECPEVFDEDEQGYPVVMLAAIPDELVPAVRACVDDCPERAISTH